MIHADGFCALYLTGINGNNAAPDGFCHVSAGVDGNDQNRCQPDTFISGKGDPAVCKVRQTVENEHSLQHHWRATENLYVNPDNSPQEF